MKTFKYNIGIPATDEAEADQKAKALDMLCTQLDGKTLKALADKVPAILKDPIKSRLVKSGLGL